MTTYMKARADFSPECNTEIGVAMLAAMRVCEIAGNHSNSEVAEAMCEAMMAVMYEHGVLWDSPPDGTDPFDIEAMQDVCFVTRRMVQMGQMV